MTDIIIAFCIGALIGGIIAIVFGPKENEAGIMTMIDNGEETGIVLAFHGNKVKKFKHGDIAYFKVERRKA